MLVDGCDVAGGGRCWKEAGRRDVEKVARAVVWWGDAWHGEQRGRNRERSAVRREADGGAGEKQGLRADETE
jgi:hypothetical protein